MPVSRPHYILSHFADNAGCGHHRILRPMELLARSGMIGGRCDTSLWEDSHLIAVQPDVVVFQRQHEDVQIAAIKRYKETLPNTFIVYELDDILSAVPEWSIHRSAIPHDVDARMGRAISHCHAVSVSTKDLARHIKEVCGDDVDVRIVPNMLGKDELAAIDQIRRNRGVPSLKPRIGWGGGISHKGDLDLLIPAIEALHDKVDFVFLGMKPDTDAPVEFHEGVPPREFLSKMASLNLDLELAPLVDCKFNRCKSNLRLLEAGACGYPVLASRVQPYTERQAPVRYVPDDKWKEAIEEWVKNPTKGDKLQEWVLRHFVFDDKAEERLRGWLPYNDKVFKPKQRSVAPSDTIIVTPGLPIQDKYKTVKKFSEVGDTNADVLYLRMGSSINEEQLRRMKTRLVGTKFASVCTVSNDGGITSFPRVNNYVPIDAMLGAKLDKCCNELFPNVTMEVPFGAGSAVLLSRKVIDMIGMPEDTAEVADIEGPLIEWCVMAASRGFGNVCAVDTYIPAAVQTVFERFRAVLARIALRWPPVQTPPDPLREVRAHLEMNFHRNHYDVPPLTSANNYDEWVAFGDEPGVRDVEFIQDFADETANLLEGWTVVTAPGAIIAPHAEYLIARAIRDNPNSVLVYGDHDFIDPESRKRVSHDFKPLALDFQMLLSRDYISPVFAIRDSKRPEFFDNWYDAILHTVDAHGADNVIHIPLCLAHLKQLTEDEATEKARIDIETANKFLVSSGRNIVVHQHPHFRQYGDVEYKVEGSPLVSIIIITGGRVEMLSPCVNTLRAFTSYKNYEILILTDKDVPAPCQEYLNTLADDPVVRVINWPHPYNWSAKNNFGVTQAKGEYYLFLNDDTRFAEGDWLTNMVGAAQLPDTGCVGARMYYPSGQIQHVGVICNEALTGHISKGQPGQNAGYNGYNYVSHQATAVTGACLLVSKERYDEVGGLDEQFAHNFNDVAFCIEMNRKGYKHVVPARAMLQHLEGVTRTSPMTDEGMRIQINEGLELGKLYPDKDPYWNWNLHFAHVGSNLFVTGLNMDTLRWPKTPWAWRSDTWRHDRLLLIGDTVDGLPDIRNGDSVYYAKCAGYNIKIERPGIENVPPFDLRDMPRARAIINGLGINKIVVGTITGGVVEVLRFINKIGVPVEYRVTTGEAVCPRTTFKPNGTSCEGGYKRGECAACLDQHSSPFGETNVDAWRSEWKLFLNSVRVDKSLAPQEAIDALQDVYGK